MPQRPSDLPEFERPPVTEVVLGMQFGRIPAFTSAHFGLFWEKIADRYPRSQEVAPLLPQFEVFGVPAPAQGGIEFGEAQYLPSRCWFISEDDTQLVQLQVDRLIHNWRAVPPATSYPRYEPLREAFAAAARALDELLQRNCSATYVANQCEVTYINHVAAPDEADWHSTPGRAITLWNDVAMTRIGGQLEDVRFSTREVIRDDNGEPSARLVMQMMPATRRSDSVSVLQLTLTVRGRPRGGGLDDVLDFFDAGRRVIVRRFKEITTNDMHRHWGLRG